METWSMMLMHLILFLGLVRCLRGTESTAVNVMFAFPWTLHQPAASTLPLAPCGAANRAVDTTENASEYDDILQLAIGCRLSVTISTDLIADFCQALRQDELPHVSVHAVDHEKLKNYEPHLIYMTLSISSEVDMMLLNDFYRFQAKGLKLAGRLNDSSVHTAILVFQSDLLGTYHLPLDHHRGVKNANPIVTDNKYAFFSAKRDLVMKFAHKFTLAFQKDTHPPPNRTFQSTLSIKNNFIHALGVEVTQDNVLQAKQLQEEYEKLLARFTVDITDITLSPTFKPKKKLLQASAWYTQHVVSSSSHIYTDNIDCTTSTGIQMNILPRDIAHDCRLLGSTCAAVLKEVHIHDVSLLPCVPRVLCGIYSTAASHNKLRILYNSWGHKCTSFITFSTEDDDHIHAIRFPHYGEEVYGNMWTKVRSIWKYIAAYYLHDFDFFLLGGDDMIYLMENLYHYLATDHHVLQAEAERLPLYIGRPFPSPHNGTYNSGGPGYLLNRAALQKLHDHLHDPMACSAFTMNSGEDLLLGKCLRELEIAPLQTQDSLGRERFHIYPAGFQFTYNLDSQLRPGEWFYHYDQVVKNGFECCSQDSIAFHYISTDLMQMYVDFLFFCPKDAIAEYYGFMGSRDYVDRIAYTTLFVPEPKIAINVDDELVFFSSN